MIMVVAELMEVTMVMIEGRSSEKNAMLLWIIEKSRREIGFAYVYLSESKYF